MTIQLVWSDAEVSDGTLTVPFTEKAPPQWREAFVRAATLLGHGNWELGAVKQGRVRVSPVRSGDEERVKHFLESAVLEANSVLAGEEELFDSEPADDAEDREEAAEPSADEQLTAKFRAFA